MKVQINTRHGQIYGELIDEPPPDWAKPAGLDIGVRHEDPEVGAVVTAWMRKSDIVSVSVVEELELDEEPEP